jgi:glycosyltransferase involved in cell wall biosynthesis
MLSPAVTTFKMYIDKLLSIVIPSYKDPLLPKTIESLLENATGDIEVIVTLDGYWPAVRLPDDSRVKLIHLGKNRGMRDAINAAVGIARGKYLMRNDEHQIYGPGYDQILTATCEDNWIVTPRRYFLDTIKWEVMDIPPVDYMKLIIGGKVRKFGGVTWVRPERGDVMIDETMAMQGSCWVMPHSWWDKVIGRLQTEGYGPLYQDSIEMVFKTWQAGGKLMVNKNTWHAHKHRDFKRTHNYGTAEAAPGWAYALNLWGDYYKKEIRPRWKI